MTEIIRPARTETFEHTISGLLSKRADLFNEAERLRDRMAAIKNDLSALDRVLGSLGYTGDLDAQMPRHKRQVIFGRGELTRAILDALRDATGPMTTREVARQILVVNEQDPRERRLLTEHTRRVSKALRILKAGGAVAASQDTPGRMVWRALQRK